MDSSNDIVNSPHDSNRTVCSYISTYTFGETCSRIIAVSPEVRVAETVEEREARFPPASGGIVTTYTYDFPGPYRKPGEGRR